MRFINSWLLTIFTFISIFLSSELYAQAQAETRDYFRFGISSLDNKELGYTQGVWAGFSWSDPPWGAWNLQVGHHRSEHYRQESIELSWEYRKTLNEHLRLFIHLGGIGAFQDFQDDVFSINQQSLRAVIGIQLEREINERLSMGVRVITLSRTLHNFKEIDKGQGRISQIVNNLDQSLLISAQLGLSYLFE